MYILIIAMRIYRCDSAHTMELLSLVNGRIVRVRIAKTTHTHSCKKYDAWLLRYYACKSSRHTEVELGIYSYK